MKDRFQVLDGWRGISILCVLAGHWFPLGFKEWNLNGAVSATGMALFFILSGFLITNLLIRDHNLPRFLIRRFMRIVPLAWLVLGITICFSGGSCHQWISSMFFYANWPPMGLIESTGHFWSLCVEVQFYVSIAALVCLLKERCFLVLPIIGVCVTLYRVSDGVGMAINTYYRADEILAGCVLALVYAKDTPRIKSFIVRLNPIALSALLILSAHPISGPLNYFRPYIALLLVGSTLFTIRDKWWSRALKSKFLFYMASISYAVYVIHGALSHTWLGHGDLLEKYLKRPLLLTVTLFLAHLSTKYFESYWINLGKRLSRAR